jgi:DNA-binding NarL/FixJ family response regulator
LWRGAAAEPASAGRCEGRSNHAIASELVVPERAVEKHVTSIFSKLALPATADDHRRVLAVLTYLQA